MLTLASLQRVASAPSEQRRTTGRLWAKLESSPPPQGTHLWDTLARRTDLATYQPQATAGVEELPQEEDGRAFVVLHSPSGAYLRLTPAEHSLWQGMDGQTSVAQLATRGLFTHGRLLPVGDLVAELHRQGFLSDRPVGIYRKLAAALEQRSVEGWGQRLLRVLGGRQWSLPGIDKALDILYHDFGWIFFTSIFATLYAFIGIGGAAAFLAGVIGNNGQQLDLRLGGSFGLGLLALGAMMLFSFVLHELGHGLAVKHFGRRVRRGGVMFYYGLPAAFVDTSDIWPEPPLHRIAVSAAGPASDLLVGGIGALIAVLAPESLLAPFGWRLALVCYTATLFNLNPLLELDGYYILVDLMRLPDLRRRALAYVRGPLWDRLRASEPLQGDERVLATYGLLAAGYVIIASIAALLFWQQQLAGMLIPLWYWGPVGRLIVIAFSLLVVAPILLGLILAVWSSIQTATNWLLRHGYGRRTDILAALALLLAFLVALLPMQVASDSVLIAVASAVLWLLGLWALVELRQIYQGAILETSLSWQIASTSLALLSAFGRLLGFDSGLLALCDGLGLAALFVAALVALPSSGIERAPRSEYLLLILIVLSAFPVSGLTLLLAGITSANSSLALLIIRSLPVYLGMLSLALLLPMILNMRDSQIVWGRRLLLLGALAQMTSYLLDMFPHITQALARSADLLAAGIWAAAWGLHLVALRQLSFDKLVTPPASASDERQRLVAGFRCCYAGLYTALTAVYGRRRAQILDDRMDIAAATANWGVTLDRDRAQPSSEVLRLGLAEQGARYAEVLRFAMRIVADVGGAPFARRAIQASYDVLPWAERETADRFIFPVAPWAKDLSQRFHSQRDTRLRLLRSLELFLNLDDQDLERLNAALIEQPLRAGEVLLRKGEVPAGLWLIDTGQIGGWRDGQFLCELHQGNTIGDWILHEQRPADMTYRASIESSLLFLPATTLDEALRQQLANSSVESQETLRLLERVPLFADAPRHLLRWLAMLAETRVFPQRHIIVRQGQRSGVLYIIRRGQAAIITSSEGPPRLVARLGPQEFFGEIEYLRDTPPMASVLAATELETLALPHNALDQLLTSNGLLATDLERIGSGRMIALRGTH